ncbi:trehalase-like [Lineus longissimus]|uniref:trehalase-like n=1 Tax=Lineus longissimus TaxID=88925 RepID=UPI002B4CDA4A
MNLPGRRQVAVGLLLMFQVFFHGAGGQGLRDMAPCNSNIYCDGPILAAMQEARFFNDSKTFVDLNMKADPDVVIAAFENMTKSGDVTREKLEAYLERYFAGPGNEFEKWDPSDWNPTPPFLNKIKHGPYRKWAAGLNELWKELGRKVIQDVNVNQQRYSLLFSAHPFIIPGGRFREFYYWDSYWVMRGLLLSHMNTTVKGMLSNFIALVKEYGFVPNGSRVYYTRRSQPPFLIPSFASYINATGDVSFLNANIATLENEYNFWMKNRSVIVEAANKTYTMNRYDVDMGRPRPESYREDMATAAGLGPDEAAERFADLASAAESGWDFSSRWLQNNNTSLTTIRTRQIIPVDLNALLCWNEKLLGKMYRTLKNIAKAETFEKMAAIRQATIMNVLWDPDDGIWYDWDMVAKRRRPGYYASNILPMFVGCYGNENGSDKEDIEKRMFIYLKNVGIMEYKTPAPTSLVNSGQQWDFPNLWPPTQHMLVEALASSNLKEARTMAFDLARKFLANAAVAWDKHRFMFEKYDVRTSEPGGGGEYDVQVGFGWTNGVTLLLLDKYGADVGVRSSATTLQVAFGLVLSMIMSGIGFT